MSDIFILRAAAPSDEMQGDDHSTDDAPLTIELRASDGRIVVRRETALGTVTRTVER